MAYLGFGITGWASSWTRSAKHITPSYKVNHKVNQSTFLCIGCDFSFTEFHAAVYCCSLLLFHFIIEHVKSRLKFDVTATVHVSHYGDSLHIPICRLCTKSE